MRRLLLLGAFGLAGAALLSACGDSNDSAQASPTSATQVKTTATSASGTAPASTTPSASATAKSSATAATATTGKVSANKATRAELQAAFEAAGISGAAQWAREVEEYRPYPANDPTFAKLRQELAKYNPGPGVVDKIVAVLEP